MKYPKLNKRLLDRVLRHIKEEPKRFNMRIFCSLVDPDAPPCGTQACIGGWAYLLTISPRSWKRMVNAINFNDFDVEAAGRKALGLTSDEARSLFLTHTSDSSYRTAKAKIELLKKDREQFVKRYPWGVQ